MHKVHRRGRTSAKNVSVRGWVDDGQKKIEASKIHGLNVKIGTVSIV